MSCLSWNCRGLGNRPTVHELQRNIQEKDRTLVFLMETKLKNAEFSNILTTSGFTKKIIVDCDMENGGR